MSGKTGLRSSRAGQFPNSLPPSPSLTLALLLNLSQQNPPQTHSSLSPVPSSLSLQTPPYPTEAAAAANRSEPWRRSPNPIAHSAKAPLPRASSARAGSLPRSPPSDPPIPSSLSPSPAACPSKRPTEAAAAASRSEPWRRSPNPIAHSAKAPPPPSLLSARRLVAAEPTQTSHPSPAACP